ncbi:hypothetical protein [Oxynema aestuarii]|uniref:Uncharacterized protein n=1 Tax=Oxynema aestuarii AP17 TaxID=2064643 RepID=A0A6H1U1N8_9CYAN|nr:hypothetical protein [Oxynema aestuarii]QIZ72297.1 hypothetical protein HCG48_18370 [Oxynema aestuarii AP17]
MNFQIPTSRLHVYFLPERTRCEIASPPLLNDFTGCNALDRALTDDWVGSMKTAIASKGDRGVGKFASAVF